MLTEAQIERYARHVLLREVGGRGQERLLASACGVEGIGEAAAWAAAYLALAGVGTIHLHDPRPAGALPPLLGPAAGGRRDEALALALSAFNPDVRLLVGPAEAAPVIRGGPGPSGPDVLTLRAGPSSLVAWGAPCPACEAAAGGGDEGPDAALAGSLAASAMLRRLLGIGPEAPPTVLLSGGEPAPCPHR